MPNITNRQHFVKYASKTQKNIIKKVNFYLIYNLLFLHLSCNSSRKLIEMSKGIFSSSIGRKFVMGLTGLFLITFISLHLLINLFSISSAELFNKASHFMATNPIIQIMQYVLALGFIIHIFMGITLSNQNNKARLIAYAMNKPGENSKFSARSMIYTGILVLLFLVLHIKDFFIELKFGNIEDVTYINNGVTTIYENAYGELVEIFSNPLYVGIYVIAFILLGIHLNHGFQSAFQSLGVNNKKCTPILKGLSVLFCFVVAIGFSAIALFHFINSLN